MKNVDTTGQYSEQGFWTKVGSLAKTAGAGVLRPAFLLYYVMQRPDVPKWVKAVVIGALAYFIMPLDAIPDVIPVVGYADDIGVMGGALGTLAVFIDTAVKERADNKLKELLGTSGPG